MSEMADGFLPGMIQAPFLTNSEMPQKSEMRVGVPVAKLSAATREKESELEEGTMKKSRCWRNWGNSLSSKKPVKVMGDFKVRARDSKRVFWGPEPAMKPWTWGWI